MSRVFVIDPEKVNEIFVMGRCPARQWHTHVVSSSKARLSMTVRARAPFLNGSFYDKKR